MPSPLLTEYYTWWFPGCPVKVHLALSVVNRLQEKLQASAGGDGSEEGLLFGSVTGSIVRINEFTPLPMAAVGNKEAIADAAQEPGNGLLVGYYRNREEGPLRLDEDDIALADALFTEPHHLFLLTQNGAGAPVATFFFREAGRMHGQLAFLDFPFNAQLLTCSEPPAPVLPSRENVRPAEISPPEQSLQRLVDRPPGDLNRQKEILASVPLPVTAQPAGCKGVRCGAWALIVILAVALGLAASHDAHDRGDKSRD